MTETTIPVPTEADYSRPLRAIYHTILTRHRHPNDTGRMILSLVRRCHAAEIAPVDRIRDAIVKLVRERMAAHHSLEALAAQDAARDIVRDCQEREKECRWLLDALLPMLQT